MVKEQDDAEVMEVDVEPSTSVLKINKKDSIKSKNIPW